MTTNYNGPLHEMACTTPTDYWNDSCSVQELNYAIERGAVGATSNPTIVMDVLKKEMPLWRDRIQRMIAEYPTAGEDFLTWRLIEEMAVRGAELLLPVFERESGLKGRLSIQTDPRNFRDVDALVEQALRFNALAPNMQIKIPATKAGIQAIEEVTYRGVNINATVSFTVPQCLAVGASVERGLKRREAEGLDVTRMRPVCTLMQGRLDDWMQVLMKRDGILVDPGIAYWAGIAAVKKAEALFHERGYRARMLSAAYRHVLHWSELIGGNIIQTIPYAWQVQYNASNIEVKDRFHTPVDERIVGELYEKFADFRRAYDEDGLSLDEFDGYGPSVRTLRTFISSYHDLAGVMRDFTLPDPDIKR
ncbi:MAG TPA: transaldolase family protein [Anaerolineaceae bacterium]|nr:transaldolase family protein [Anaerolineaceae bacterium]